MMDFDKTTRFSTPVAKTGGQVVTIFDADLAPKTIDLAAYKKTVITFGREDTPGVNDIVLISPLVSRRHGRFVCVGGKWRIEDTGSTNGLICNNTNIVSREISDGDFVRIDDGIQSVAAGVLFAFSSGTITSNQWQTLDISREMDITIGRSPDCKLVLPHVSVSKYHARIVREGTRFVIYDNGSTNGVIVNGRRIIGREVLNEKDIINITNSKLIFTSGMISFCHCKNGITVDASNIVIRRGRGRKSFVTCNNVSLNIQPGELVAVIGGSGAGKSTVLNAMCGYLKPTKGNVYINGIDLYQNFDSIKKLMGYVPQSDIVYDNLTIYDMLKYTAKLRLPKDTSEKEMENAISRAIATVELTEKKNSFIKALSGGQRKRASIAVELLSDPNLLFLDEPASGLDPGTERNLMVSLREMANSGKTVILVTHSTLQLKLCDKIVFMGKGGNLCFYGSYDEALRFFGVSDIVDIYRLITDNAPMWRDKYAATVAKLGDPRATAKTKTKKPKKYRMKQFGVMSARYAKLITNEKQKLLIMLLIPLTTFCLIFAKGTSEDATVFGDYTMANMHMFVLACLSFFIGMSSSIQEICKEKTILRREYMAGLSLTSYVMSKVAILFVISIIQAVMITAIYLFAVERPDSYIELIPPEVGFFLSSFLITFAASITGLIVSATVKNPDKVAPLFYIMQIVFSGVLFELPPAAAFLSYIAICHWGVISLGNGVLLNSIKNGDNYICQAQSEKDNLYEKLGDFLEEVSPGTEDAIVVADKSGQYVGTYMTDMSAYEEACQQAYFVQLGLMVIYIVAAIVITRIVIQSVSREKS